MEAANDVWHVAPGFAGVIGPATQFAMGMPPSLNVMVPAGEPGPPLTVANSVTVSFVTSAEEEATIEVVLGPAAWTSGP